MNIIEIFARGDQDYFLVIKENNITFYLEESFSDYEKENKWEYMNFINIRFTPKVFIELSKLLNVDLNNQVSPNPHHDIPDYQYIQNEDNEKLIIDETKQTYMIKKFISKTNEEDFSKIPNDLYDKVIKALQNCNYKQITYNEEYFITKKEILCDIYEAMKLDNLSHRMIERYDYFDYNLIKDFFLKLYNEEIEEDTFRDFCYLMLFLLLYYPSNISIKKQNIYKLASYLFDGLSFGQPKDEKSSISNSFAMIKQYYNELHNIKNKNKLYLYYSFNHCNWKMNNDVYEVSIVDKKNKLYWMGFVNDPIFDFDLDYIDPYLEKHMNSNDFNLINTDFDEEEYEEDNEKQFMFSFILPDDYYRKYTFDETLKDKYFKKYKKQ